MKYSEMNEVSEEQKITEKYEAKISSLKEVIVKQATDLLELKTLYEEATEFAKSRMDYFSKTLVKNDCNISEIKDLLKLAKKCADDTTKSQRQRDISKIRVELLNDVLDILEGEKD